MVEMKKVICENGEITSVLNYDYTSTDLPKGVTIEEREMEYTSLHGWREVGWKPPLTEMEQIKAQNLELRGTIDFILTDLIPSLFE